MNLPNDYATASSATQHGSSLPAGGYVCRIRQAGDRETWSGSRMFYILFDIEEGEHAGHFTKRYEKDIVANPKAKWRGSYQVFLLTRDHTTNPFFKGLLTAIEESNACKLTTNGVLDETKLKGKLVGLLFGEEEFIGQDNLVHTAVRPRIAINVENIRNGNWTIPKKRELPAEKKATVGMTEVKVEEDDLPF